MSEPDAKLHRPPADAGDCDARPAGRRPEDADARTVMRSSAQVADPAADTELEELTERTLGDFRLLRRLGRGGMAEVYLAEQISLKRNVAVKVLRQDLMAESDDSMLQRFRQEAHAAAALSHPNIIQVYAIGEEGGIHYIAQEYVQGTNLREYLRRKGPPDAAVALHLMRQAAAALQAAGDAGIVHRDIKPENLMLTRKGKVKIADFGLARLMQGGERVNLTQVGITMGTPLYMSPEQVNGQPVDPRSDLYSLGVTFWHLLAGQPPFRGETALSIAVQHVKEAPPPLAERRPDVPPALCAIVHKLMAKRPEDRYPNAQALLNDLKRISQALKAKPGEEGDLDLGAFDSGAIATPRRSAVPWRRLFQWIDRRQATVFIAACVLVGSASAGVGWWMRPSDPRDVPPSTVSKIPRQNTAVEQYLKAKFLEHNEDAWWAVIEYFPHETWFKRGAQVQLALLYLRSGRHSEAESIFNELVSVGETESWKAAGFAGQAVLASLRGNHARSQEIIAFSLADRREHLDNHPELRRLVQEAISHNREALGEAFRKDLEELFQREPVELENGELLPES